MADELESFKSPAELAAEARAHENPERAAADRAQAEQERRGAQEIEAGDRVDEGQGKPAEQQQGGKEEPSEGEAASPALTPRQKAMAEIAKKSQEARDAEFGEIETAHGTRQEQVEGRAKEVDESAAAEGESEQSGQAAQQEPTAEADYVIRKNEQGVDCAVLKVNGQEVLKPLREVIAQAQKGEAAEIRLQKASQTLREIQAWKDDLDQREQTLASRLEQLSQRIQNSTQQPSPADADRVKTSMKSFMEAIYNEDTESAMQHFQEAMSGRGNSTLPESGEDLRATVTGFIDELKQIGDQRADRTRIEQVAQEAIEEDWQQGRQTFMTEFPEIKQGSEAWRLASKFSAEIAEDPAFRDKSYSEIFREAGKRVRNLAREFSPSITDRTQRKLASQEHVASRGGITQTRSREEPAQPKSQHDLIKAMRQRRRPTQNY